MIQRWLHAIFGHNPMIRVTEIRASPDVDPEDYVDRQFYYIHKFGAVTISMMCPCGRAGQQVLLGKQIEIAAVKDEIAELKRLASL